MYLSEFLGFNYRSCQNIHIKFDDDYPNILIGINDSGKSSVLQAIGLLLTAKPKFNFASEDKKKNDISNTPITEKEFLDVLISKNLPILPYIPQQSVFIGRFVLEETDINPKNEDSLSNNLRWAIEKTDDNSLWLARIFNGEKLSYSCYLLTKDNEENSSIFNQNAASLNKIKKDLDISSEEIANANKVGRFKNIDLIIAIYKRYKLIPSWVEYETDKNFWPEFRYLDWNFSLDDLYQFANDVVSHNISSQIDLATRYAREQASEAQEIINQELIKLADSLKADLININSIQANINFQVSSTISDIMVRKENSDGVIHLDSQGDGVKRQLWFALLKWKAFNTIPNGVTNTKFIWCFDEPETHLYPKAQREFFEIIKTISLTNVQSIISTHSTVFIDRAKLKNINKVDLEHGYSIFSKCVDTDDIYESLQIKNSDFLFFDKFLVVEGDTEQALIPFLYKLIKKKTLEEDCIQLINLGGKSKRYENQKTLKNTIGGFRKETSSNIVYIFDNDAKIDFSTSELREINHIFIGKQDIEDSIDPSVWLSLVRELTDNQIPIDVLEIKQLQDNIPNAENKQKLNTNQKFYEQLKRLVYHKANEIGLDEFQNSLPTKGLDSGKIIAKHINSISQISPDFQIAFDKLVP